MSTTHYRQIGLSLGDAIQAAAASMSFTPHQAVWYRKDPCIYVGESNLPGMCVILRPFPAVGLGRIRSSRMIKIEVKKILVTHRDGGRLHG